MAKIAASVDFVVEPLPHPSFQEDRPHPIDDGRHLQIALDINRIKTHPASHDKQRFGQCRCIDIRGEFTLLDGVVNDAGEKISRAGLGARRTNCSRLRRQRQDRADRRRAGRLPGTLPECHGPSQPTGPLGFHNSPSCFAGETGHAATLTGQNRRPAHPWRGTNQTGHVRQRRHLKHNKSVNDQPTQKRQPLADSERG